MSPFKKFELKHHPKNLILLDENYEQSVNQTADFKNI